MEPIKSSLQGGTPELAIQPADPNHPPCGAVSPEGHVCTRGEGHGDGVTHYSPKTETHDAHHW